METNNRYAQKLLELKEAGNYRVLPEISGAMIDLCSNDYLSLNNDPLLYQNFIGMLSEKRSNFSSCSSRLLSGNYKENTELEAFVAALYQAESCLVYNSGYHANTGILPALAGKKDLIIADKLVHASIIDGALLSQAVLMRYNHLDYAHLEKILEKNRSAFETVFIVSESIFSMDGDLADLNKLCELKQKYNCLLYLDEAHALGVRGKNGLGCAEESGLIPEIDFLVATLGKALASVGAFVVCSNLFRQYLINHSRTLIFTTALPPVNLAWTKFIFEKLPDLCIQREKLKLLSAQFSKLVGADSSSHIIPFIIGSNHDAVNASLLLKKNGFNVLPIRYPTVPKGTARLRFSLNAALSFNDLIPIKEILQCYE